MNTIVVFVLHNTIEENKEGGETVSGTKYFPYAGATKDSMHAAYSLYR